MALVQGNLYPNFFNASTLGFKFTNTTGGVAPYTYQLQRGTFSSAGVFGTFANVGTPLVTSSTGTLSLTDPTPPSAGTVTGYQYVVTDSTTPTALTATSGRIIEALQPAAITADAPSVVQGAYYVNASGATTGTATLNAAATAGNRLQISIYTNGASTVIGVPSGFSLIQSSSITSPAAINLYVYEHAAAGGETSFTVTSSVFGALGFEVIEVTNSLGIDVSAITTTSTAGTSFTAPSVTSTKNNGLVLSIFASNLSNRLTPGTTVDWTAAAETMVAASASGGATLVSAKKVVAPIGSVTAGSIYYSSSFNALAATVVFKATYGTLSVSPTTMTFTTHTTQTITPSETNYTGGFSYSSSNTAIATVNSSGVVTPVANGSCTITVSDTNSQTATVAVTCSSLYGPIVPSPTSLVFTTGGSQTITPSETGYSGSYTYVSSDTTIATVNRFGVVSKVAPGNCTITISDTNSQTATVQVDVYGTIVPAASTIWLQTIGATSSISPTEAHNSGSFTYSSSNTAAATVNSSGVVTSVGYGVSNITVSDTHSQTLVVPVTVRAPVVAAPTSLLFANASVAPQTITASETGYAGAFTYTSTDPTIATVNSAGLVTAVDGGTCSITVSDANADVYINNIASVTVNVHSLIITNTSPDYSSGGIFTVSEDNFSGTFTCTSSDVTVCTVDATLTGPVATGNVTAVGPGNSIITVSDGVVSQTFLARVTGPMLVSPPLLIFQDALASPQVLTVTEDNFDSTITASVSTTVIQVDQLTEFTFQVSPLTIGETSITFTDGHGGLQVVGVTVGGSVDGTSRSVLLQFTGVLEQDQQDRQPFRNDKTVHLLDLTKQFQFPVYDTFPHPLYGDQTLPYFDKHYNLTNPSGDGRTWICLAKMFSVSSLDKVWGTNHIDPALFIDLTGGSTPQRIPVVNGAVNVVGTTWNGTAYSFDYKNGIVILNTAVPTHSIVSLAGNPTYMSPEDMVTTLFVNYASWAPNAIICDKSNILLPMYSGENKPLWQCVNEIAEMTNPRLTPWTITADETGFLHFRENAIDGPPVKEFIDERDFITLQEVNDASTIATVATAQATVAVSDGQDQPVQSIAYDLWAFTRYGQTAPLQIDGTLLTMSVRHLTPQLAISAMDMMTCAAVSKAARPILTIQAEVWPDPSIQIGDLARVYSVSEGVDRFMSVRGIDRTAQPGQFKETLRLEEYIETINFLTGPSNTIGATPGGVGSGSNGAPGSLGMQKIIGAVRMGNTAPIYPLLNSDFARDPSTGQAVVPIWNANDLASMHFDVYLNSPGLGAILSALTSLSTAFQYNYQHLPTIAASTWTLETDADSIKRYYTTDGTYTYVVGPDNVFYKFAGTGQLNSTTAIPGNVWTPTGNTTPTSLGGAQTYTGSPTTVYLWQWWYLCLDTTLGVGKPFRFVQRVNTTQDGVAVTVRATGGTWINNSWGGGPGPLTTSSLFDQMAVGITNYTATPVGFVGAPVYTDGSQYGVAFGYPTSGGTYIGYQKRTRGHYCILAANAQGNTQFFRIPFHLIL